MAKISSPCASMLCMAGLSRAFKVCTTCVSQEKNNLCSVVAVIHFYTSEAIPCALSLALSNRLVPCAVLYPRRSAGSTIQLLPHSLITVCLTAAVVGKKAVIVSRRDRVIAARGFLVRTPLCVVFFWGGGLSERRAGFCEDLSVLKAWRLGEGAGLGFWALRSRGSPFFLFSFQGACGWLVGSFACPPPLGAPMWQGSHGHDPSPAGGTRRPQTGRGWR